MKSLFIPLKTAYFRAFENGSKTTEFRVYGKRWHEGTCPVGRLVTLSCGYSGARLYGRIVRFNTSTAPTQTAEWQDCYGIAESQVAACIGIELYGAAGF
jgi:hypothetical protein